MDTLQIKPVAVKIDESTETMYYNSKELQEYDQDFYYGCKTKPRNIIDRKKIPSSDYVYANLKSKEWNLSSAECKKAQLLISKTWVDKHLFKINIDSINVEERKSSKPKMVIEDDDEDEQLGDNCVENAPPLLHLIDEDKFRDCEGKIIEIETRGEKCRNKIYFNVKDVMNGFNIEHLNSTLTDNRNSYNINVHYVNFIREFRHVNNMSKLTNKKYKTALYLTYKGILRVLFVSRSGNAEKFQDWAEERLFTVQMGSKEAKIKLGTDILNISAKTYNAVFDSYASNFPSIYLLSLGKVSALRETFKIDPNVADNLVVYKYGFTKNLSQRFKEHTSTYGKLPNVVINLSTFHYIDIKYISEAEGKVRSLCNTFNKNLIVDGYNELIALDEKEQVQIKQWYKHTGNEFAGATAELTRSLELKDNIIKEKDYQIEILKKDNKIELLEKDTIIKEKDYIILSLKMEHKNDLLLKDFVIQREVNEKNLFKMQLRSSKQCDNLTLG